MKVKFKLPIGIFLFLTWTFSFQFAIAENQSLVGGLVGGTMGAGIATSMETMSLGHNPASFHAAPKNQMTAGMQLDFNRPFGTEEMRMMDGSLFFNNSFIGLGISWRETAVLEFFRERAITVNPSLRLENLGRYFLGKVDLGGDATIWSNEIVGETKIWKCTQSLGLAWTLNEQVKLGAFAQGLNLNEFQAQSERIWHLGLEVKSASGSVKEKQKVGQILHLDFRKTFDSRWRSMAGLTLVFHPCFQVAVGLSTPPIQLAIGAKVGWGGLSWNQSLRYHEYLGRTILSGMSYVKTFGK